jgi:hypothetical protein
MTAVARSRAWCDGDATYTMVPSLTTARMRRADVDLGGEEMRTVDSSDITKSVQEPILPANEPTFGSWPVLVMWFGGASQVYIDV